MSGGKDKSVLVTVNKVSPESLPFSLRHYSKDESLRQANELLLLLDEVCGSAQHSDFFFQAWDGMRLVLQLVQDKVAIASGEYHFPLSGLSDDPALVEREEE